MAVSVVRTRIAPSPTGFPHIGTAYQAVFDYAFSRKNKGRFILRIEDTDQSRQVAGAEEAIRDALIWLDLIPDEDPWQGGPYGPYRQSERLEIYQQYAHQLVEQGQAYYCFCPRERLEEIRREQENKHQAPRYDRHCRVIPLIEAKNRIDAGEPFVVRLKVPDEQKIVVPDLLRGEVEFESDYIDDQVLLKSDGFPTYHLAVVVDDHLMKITHVVRGEEWLPSAPKHILLYQFFEWPLPKFIHLPLLRGTDRGKISKRGGHTSLLWYRTQGFLPAALVNFIASIVWHAPDDKEIFGMGEMISSFRWQDLSVAAPVFDITKLEWMNGVYIRQMDPEEFGDYLVDWLVNYGGESCPIASEAALKNPEKVKQVALLEQGRLKKLVEFEEAARYFFEEETGTSDVNLVNLLEKRGRDQQTTVTQLQKTLEVLEKLSSWKVSSIQDALTSLKEKNSWQPKYFFMILRVAISGREITPPLFETIEVLGRKLVLKRIKKAIALLP